MVIKHVERRVRLSDSHIKKLRQKDKLFSVGDSEVPGLRIYVETSGTKNFYYCYKPKNEKNWVRIKLGNFTLLNVPGAFSPGANGEFYIKTVCAKLGH